VPLRPTLISIAICLSLSACDKAPVNPAEQSQTQATITKPINRSALDGIIDKHTVAFLQQQPTLGTALGLDDTVAGNHRVSLPDYSPSGFDTMRETMRQAATELSALSREDLSVLDRLHLETNQIIDQYYAGDKQFKAGFIDTWGGQIPYVVNQIWSPVMGVPTTMQDQQLVANAEQAEDYLTRLKALTKMVQQVEDKAKSDADSGVVLPENLFPNTLLFLTNFVTPPAEQHALVTSFADKLDALPELNEEQKNGLIERAAQIVQNDIYPQYAQLHSYLTDLQTRAPQGDGIWAQPGGAEFYLHQIKYQADSDLSPQQIHQIGLDEVSRISAEMDQLLSQNGRTEGTVGARMNTLADDPQFIFADSPQGREELLAYLRTQINNVMAVAPSLFATMPSQAVVVKRVPEVSQASAPGGYYSPPSLDGSRPGEFFINLRDMQAVPHFSLKTLVFHEAVPGHHFQIALNMAQTDIGIMRQNAPFNAFAEGWALYAEQVAKEMGMYEGDPWGDLGRLQGELYRAVRLVVDTGLHYKKWSRHEAIDYFHQTTGNALSDVTSEIERYMAMPGQALGYKLGMLKLLQLRELALSELGDKFDIKIFHDLILLPGARPMSLVEGDVRRWIDLVKQQGEIKAS
jgi:uncharacterized protein (DUF885 family)